MALRSVDQLGFDERVVSDVILERVLEERARRRADLGEARKTYDGAHQLAMVEIEKLKLDEGEAARIGRWRITRSSVAARSVAFDTKPTTRITIALAADE